MGGSSHIAGLADAVLAMRGAQTRREVGRIEAEFALAGHAAEEVAVLGQVAAMALDRLRARADARQDPLTGVHNRRGFFEAAHERIAACPGPVAVGMFDVDGLKAINDRFGHAAGSTTLRAAAEALQGAFGDAVVGRIGGDEFAAVVLDRSDTEVLRRRLDATLRGRRAMPDVVSLDVSAGFSAGIAVRPRDLDELLREADADLYARRAHHRRAGAARRFAVAPSRVAAARA